MKRMDFFEERGLDRIIGLSDGVFAFALTLLSMELIVPSLTGNDISKLTTDLFGETPIVIYFFFTFMITGAYWLSHHRIFRFIIRYDELILRLNLSFLLFITLIPFVTKLIALYGNEQIVAVVGAVGYGAPGLLLSLMWHYSSRNNLLIEEKVSLEFIRITTIRFYVIPSIFLLSIPFSFIHPSYEYYFWLILFPVKGIEYYAFGKVIDKD
jgi:uncharacterized membrane protein